MNCVEYCKVFSGRASTHIAVQRLSRLGSGQLLWALTLSSFILWSFLVHALWLNDAASIRPGTAQSVQPKPSLPLTLKKCL